MVDLDPNAGAVFVHRLRQFKQTGDVVIVVDSKLCRSVGTLRGIYTGVFYHNETGSAFGSLFVVINMEKTHFSALLPIIGSHGGHHDPVFHCHPPDSQWFKDMFILVFHKNPPKYVNKKGKRLFTDRFDI